MEGTPDVLYSGPACCRYRNRIPLAGRPATTWSREQRGTADFLAPGPCRHPLTSRPLGGVGPVHDPKVVRPSMMQAWRGGGHGGLGRRNQAVQKQFAPSPSSPAPPGRRREAGRGADPYSCSGNGGMGAWACICRGVRRACRTRPAAGRASGDGAPDAAPLRRAPAAEAVWAQMPGAGAAACGARPRSGRNGGRPAAGMRGPPRISASRGQHGS